MLFYNYNNYRGTLASRHKPSGEALKCQILKRQHFLSKDNSPAPPETSTPPPTPHIPFSQFIIGIISSILCCKKGTTLKNYDVNYKNSRSY